MKYFPPIKLDLFGDENVSGPGFGIFASADIEKKVFIGEYAADLFEHKNSRFCSRQDMTYSLFSVLPPCNSLVLGPIRYNGYIPLLNDLGKNNNCKSIITIVGNKLRVIVYSHREIK